MIMRIHMSKLGNSEVLAGAINGRKVLAKLLELAEKEPTTPEQIFLDFAGVSVATASFLRETVLAYRDTVRRRRSNLYPVVANANQVVEDELKVLVSSDADVLMLCQLDAKGQPRQPRLLGKLDPKQRLTFDLVQKRRETDAAELMREHRDTEGVKQTAWNNRLSALANMGLVVELSEGRAKRYRPLFTES
jgi:hypothetical protein